ncbi:hypothetical protein KPL70_014259 [Citrus sinensis]|nr:hypothetical protein KPL70_014259 [Citrus sinensis]
MSPYNLYKQKTSFTRSIRTLISTKRPLPKEYIQSSRLDQCALQASQSEQYVTMEIPSDLVANWKREGYTHLHLGGVRLILTLHGRKGLPVTARIALLDTRHRHNSNHYPNPQTNPKQELLRLMPLEWLTNYEHFHQNLEPVQTIEATFNRRPNGQVKLSFQTPNTQPVSNSPQLSYTAMITAVQTGKEKKLPIHGFSSEGYPVYLDKVNGHFLWDVPEAHMCNPDCPCLDDTDIDKELEIMRRKKKKKKKSSYPSSSCKSFPPHPPPDPKPPVHPIRSCLMFSSHSYEESFPPLEKQTDTQTRVTSKPFVQSPITTSGQPEEPKQYEAVLNWQTKNAKAQNHTLQQLGKKIDCVATQVSQTETKVDSINSRLDLMYIHLQDRISELDADLRRMINNHIWGPEFNKKEAEIRKLKAELSRIDAEKTQPSLFTQSQPTPVSPPFFETYSPFYTPSRPQQPVYNKFFRFSHLQPTPQPSSPKKARSKVKISEPRPKATSSSSTSTIPPEESPQDHSSDSSEPETHNSCSSSSYDSSNASTNSESEYADITGILMASETADPSASTSTPIVADNPSDQASQTEPIPLPVHEHLIKPSSTSWFTFDDIPRHKWAARLQEFAAWIDLQVQSTQDDQTAFLIAESSDSEDISVISTVQTVNHVSTIPRPSLKMSILPSKFHKHIPVIGFIDIGADTSMIDPSVLPSDSWEPHSKLFRAVNGETFETTLITKKPIGIQFFPNCIIWKKIVASKLPDKDLLIGFDILHLVKNLFLTSSGVRYKHMFLPYTDTLRLYALSETPSPYSHISQKLLEFYPENHSQFHHPSPLWKNEQFFIHLPFKLNEDINPTKASHPVDHHKTAFCIPDAHYQWTVMPFGLKVATSLFQKAMTKIFSPILHHALVYIDDILLFSSNHESHQKLLLDFFHIVQAHGIMLSEKKSSIGKESIDFLGMVIKDGQYQPGPHIAIELLKFPNTHLNRKQIQQFLGIVNYVRDFIPKVTIHTSQLSRMLKKQCPPWGPAQIEAVKQLKTKKPDRFPNLCMEHLFLTGLTLSSLSISEDELWYMWCLTTLYATKLVFPIKPVLTHLTTPEFSPDLLWTLFEWYSPLTWWRQQLQHLSTFHGLDKMSAQEANMWTTAFIVHRPYFQYPETRDYWTQDMAYEWRTYPHPYTFIHDTSVTSVLKAYLMELNNVPPPTTDIHHTSIGPSHTLEIIPKTQGCTLGSSSSPHGILVMEQRPDYTNVLFQDAQDPWKDFQSLLHTDTPCYTVTNPDSPAPSTSQHMSEVDEEKYQQAEAYLDQRQRHRHKRQYEKDTGDVSPSRYPSTP